MAGGINGDNTGDFGGIVDGEGGMTASGTSCDLAEWSEG